MRCRFITLGVVVLFCLLQTGRCDDTSENLEDEEVTFEETIANGRKDVMKEWERDATVLAFNRIMDPFFKLEKTLRYIRKNKPNGYPKVEPVMIDLRRKFRLGLTTMRDAFMDRLQYAKNLEGKTSEDLHKLFNKMKGMSKALLDKNKASKCKEDMLEKIEKYELIYSTFALNCEKTSNLLFSLVRMPHRKLLYSMNKNIVDAVQKLEPCNNASCYDQQGQLIQNDIDKLDSLIKAMHHKDNIDEVEMKASKWLFNACAESFIENYGDALKLIQQECSN